MLWVTADARDRRAYPGPTAFWPWMAGFTPGCGSIHFSARHGSIDPLMPAVKRAILGHQPKK